LIGYVLKDAEKSLTKVTNFLLGELKNMKTAHDMATLFLVLFIHTTGGREMSIVDGGVVGKVSLEMIPWLFDAS